MDFVTKLMLPVVKRIVEIFAGNPVTNARLLLYHPVETSQ